MNCRQIAEAVTDGRCHHCGASVKVLHGSEPDNPGTPRHYFKCGDCNGVGVMYPLYSCEGCNSATSEGGEIITYEAPQVARKASHGAILSALRPMDTAVQMRMKL